MGPMRAGGVGRGRQNFVAAATKFVGFRSFSWPQRLSAAFSGRAGIEPRPITPAVEMEYPAADEPHAVFQILRSDPLVAAVAPLCRTGGHVIGRPRSGR
jgi:hypothetical protein